MATRGVVYPESFVPYIHLEEAEWLASGMWELRQTKREGFSQGEHEVLSSEMKQSLQYADRLRVEYTKGLRHVSCVLSLSHTKVCPQQHQTKDDT